MEQLFENALRESADVFALAQTHNWNMPTSCPICGGEIELSDNHKHLKCINPSCKSKGMGRIGKWCGVLGIKEMGLTTIEKFIDNGIVEDISDLYKLTTSDITKLERFGERSAAAIIREINAHKELTPSQFLAGYNIAGCGTKVFDKIFADHPNLLENFPYSLVNASVSDVNSKGIGDTTAAKVLKGIKDLIEDMIETLDHVNIKQAEAKQKPTGDDAPLAGLSFCFTGKACMPRSQLQAIVDEKGGENWGSVKKGLSYLVTDDVASGSAKNKKAKELGTAVITSTKFLELAGVSL